MPATIPAAVTADRLRSFLERIEKLLEERAAIQSDIKDVFSEAKGVGYDVKTMRRLIQIRAQDTADRAEQEALLDTYMAALGMNTYAVSREPTEEELEERASRIVSEVDRCVALVEGGKPPSIAAIRQEIGCSLGKASKIRGMVEARISLSLAGDRENETPPIDIVTSHATADYGGAPPTDEPEIGGEARPGTYSDGNPDMGIPISAPPTDTRTFDEIVGPLPGHLRRVR